jgi:hypothetical protein
MWFYTLKHLWKMWFYLFIVFEKCGAYLNGLYSQGYLFLYLIHNIRLKKQHSEISKNREKWKLKSTTIYSGFTEQLTTIYGIKLGKKR